MTGPLTPQPISQKHNTWQDDQERIQRNHISSNDENQHIEYRNKQKNFQFVWHLSCNSSMLKQPCNANKISTHFLTTALPTAQPAIHITYKKSTVEHRLFCQQNRKMAQNCSHYTRYKCCTEALSKRHATIFSQTLHGQISCNKLDVRNSNIVSPQDAI